MIEEVKKDILKILEEALQAFKARNYVALKDISNHTIHNASIIQDEDSISVAVIIFSLFKIATRCEGREGDVCGSTISAIKYAYELLKRDREGEYKLAVKSIFKAISETDRKFGFYVEEVINQAEIKKGSKIYEHGISLARTAEILGISQWELMNYIGKTRIPEIEGEPFDIRKRLDFTKKLFGVQYST